MRAWVWLREVFAPSVSNLRAVAISLGAIAAALVVSGLAVALAGVSPALAYRELLKGAFGSPLAIGVTITKATPLLLAGLGVALPFRCGLLNIGGEGQIYVGAMGATLAALYLPGLPWAVHLPLVLAAGFLGGALWGALPAYLRVRRGLSEIINTIMLNYVGFWLVSFMVHGPIKDPNSYGYPWTVTLPVSAQLPMIAKAARVNLGIVVAVLAALAVHFLLWHTSLGFEMRAVGAGAKAARFAGIHVSRSMVLALGIGGGLAGLAGTAEVTGVQLRLSDFFSPGYGYDAIAVALVGQTSPAGVVLAALFFGALRNGAESLQRSIAVPASIAQIIQALTLIFVVAGNSARLARAWQRRRKVALVDHPEPAVSER